METIKKEFELSFQLSKREIFEVCYHTIGGNKYPYFSTSGGIFNQPKTDWDRCGQCQEAFIRHRAAYNFFKKWDVLHTQDLTDAQYNDLIIDIESLKQKYNCINSISFSDVREFSKQTPKK